MSDDVKVKFGGDFSGIAEGAKDAANRAGTAMAASFKDYGKSIASSIGNFFSVENLMGKALAGLKDASAYFREIDELSRKLGVSRVDLQKFGKIGAEVGISMESMAKTIQIANKNIGAAEIANGAQRKSLIDLGFTEQEITEGRVTAIDVMMKLADQYDRGIDQNIIAKRTTDVFGRSGQELNKILREGTDALKERIATMEVFTEAEVRGAAHLDRQYAKLEKKIERKKKEGLLGLEKIVGLDELTSVGTSLTRIENKTIPQGWAGNTKISEATPEMIQKIATDLSKEMAREEVSKKDLLADLEKMIGSAGTKPYEDYLIKLHAAIEGSMKKPGEAKAVGESVHEAMATTSLQAIGGGDLGAIMSGYHDPMLEAATTTAQNTTILAQKATEGQTTKPASVAK